ncbi:hypothetical protein DNK06_21615 [Pseudomonas daroniae]|uniref:Uncharacterized protein n=1 Tax=Phytopseudomonas daroniae TaxID=2487519 RepID=A0A4Q9QHJ5_9GAMM|nr:MULTISPECIES: hypothetical protein [Pseudomonas]TBU72575.1 hypothetical protein DNK10_21100 [Pseudomonas daroniae]TBU72688.1 hypothetical protein DNK06_21615 [Pseudomonas daroniae]TBU77489.1 hypothetical protein DNK31_21585 [Pseudomonas sp. FRB 228]TBU87573.1 hypothetical protein DNJ99_21465 [Pseudomonas daroniae]
MGTEPLSKPQLKELVRRVIVAQGNAFIKELLRGTSARIGATKEDFAANLDAAIDADELTQENLEAWLAEVEGWGDQHLYLIEPPQIEPGALAAGIAASPHAGALSASASLEFPETLELKHIGLGNGGLSMVWHQCKAGWNRWKPKDFVVEEGLERYRFDAYRQRLDRSVVRYEWRFGDPYCAILIHRNPDIDHKAVFQDIRATLAAIGCSDTAPVPIPLNQAVKVAAAKGKGVHSTRFELDGGYVEMASTLAEGGIEAVEPVRVVLQAVDTGQFDRAQGMLHFAAEEHGTSRRIAVQVYGREARLRIWAQCKREDIVRIVELLWEYNNAP